MDTHSSSQLLAVNNSLLLVVDVQEKLLPAMSHPERLTAAIATLIKACSLLPVPIVVTEQVPHKLGHTAPELLSHLPVEAATFEKTSFGCGESPDILAFINSLERKQVILCGLETHICVNQTAHQLIERGYQVHLITDAVQSRAKHNHKAAIVRMIQAGIIPSTVEAALFELLGHCEHPQFRAIQALVK